MSDDLARLRAHYERLEVLGEVSNVIHSTLDPQEALQLILQEAMRVTRASSGSVTLVNPTTGLLEIEASRGLPNRANTLKLRLGEGIPGWVARSGKPVLVGDVTQDSRYLPLSEAVRSALAVPLAVNGEVRGVLTMDSDRLNAFGPADQQFLEDLAIPAARVIHHTWLHEQLRLKAQLFEALLRVGKAINSTLDLDGALQVIVREAGQLMTAKMCSLMLVSEDGEWLDLRAHSGAGPDYVNKPRLSVADSLLGVVVRRQKPVQIDNVQTSSRYQNVDVARREGLVSLLSVPLLFRGGVSGAINVYTAQPHSFSNEEINILAALGELSAIAIEKARLYERIVDVEEQLRRNEKLSALGLLAAEVAHEIRNPLTVMKMLYHSLDLRFPPGDPRAKDAQVMGEKMDHLNRIVERILDFARSTEPQLAPVSVNQLLDDLGLLTRHKLSHQAIELVRELEPDLPLVLADRGQLEQAFLNLMLNGVEAMPGGGRLTLRTRSARPSQKDRRCPRVIVEFQDSGDGMPGETLQRAFSSLLDTTKPKGTGLGLAIVGRIVEAHRGQVKARSLRGKGTTVTVTLPLA